MNRRVGGCFGVGLLAVCLVGLGFAPPALGQVQVSGDVQVIDLQKAAVSPEKLKEIGKQLEEAAKKLREAAAKNDAKAVEAALQQIEETRKQLEDLSKAAGRVIRIQPGNGIQINPRIKPAPKKPEQKEPAKPQAKFEREAYGLVWRDLDSALEEAKKTGKPVFVFHSLGDLFGKL